MTQQRAIETRSALILSAAGHFGKYGFAAASVNGILANSDVTKGAMYFHFKSKLDMAEAVLDAARQVYTGIADYWTDLGRNVSPLVAIGAMVTDAAESFISEPALRAEARLSVEPQFVDQHPWAKWNAAATDLARRAVPSGELRDDVSPDAFVRMLTVSLTGHRLLAHGTAEALSASIRSGYAESFKFVVAATTPRCVR